MQSIMYSAVVLPKQTQISSVELRLNEMYSDFDEALSALSEEYGRITGTEMPLPKTKGVCSISSATHYFQIWTIKTPVFVD